MTSRCWAMLAVAVTGVFWALSYRQPVQMDFVRGGQRWRIASIQGQLLIDNQLQRQLDAQVIDARRTQLTMLREELAFYETHGQRRVRIADGSVAESAAITARIRSIVRVPAPIVHPANSYACRYEIILLAALAVLARLQLRLVGAYFRGRRGLCVTCGFDLRASRGRCPECGMAIQAPPNLLRCLKEIAKAAENVARRGVTIATPTIRSPLLLLIDLCGWMLLLVSVPAVTWDLITCLRGLPLITRPERLPLLFDSTDVLFAAALIWLVYRLSLLTFPSR